MGPMATEADIPREEAHRKRRGHRYTVGATAAVLGAALVSAAMTAPGLPDADADGNLYFYLLGTCLLTALVEELVFRGVLLRALLHVCRPRATMLVTAALFAALHALPIGIQGDMPLAFTVVSLSMKFLEAFAFGIVMAAILFCGGTLISVIVLHAAFDCIYFAGPVLASGDFPATYVVTSPEGLAALAAATVILAIPAVFALRLPVDERAG